MIKHLGGYCTLEKHEIEEMEKNQTAEQKKLGDWIKRLWDKKV